MPLHPLAQSVTARRQRIILDHTAPTARKRLPPSRSYLHVNSFRSSCPLLPPLDQLRTSSPEPGITCSQSVHVDQKCRPSASQAAYVVQSHLLSADQPAQQTSRPSVNQGTHTQTHHRLATDQPAQSTSRPSADPLRSFGYYKVSPIAQGAFSIVVRARRNDSKDEFAVKSWLRSKLVKHRQLAGAMRTELDALGQLSGHKHPNVANLVDVLEGQFATHAVLEYCGGGSLLKYMQTKGHGRGLEEGEAAQLVRQLSAGLAAIHAAGVVHRDIKPANVLFTDGAHRSIKICDFGFALVCHQRRIKSICGSPAYMAPELWKREPYLGPPVDMWALGALAFELLHNRPCFSDETMHGLEVRIMRGAHCACRKETSAAFRNLLEGVFNVNVAERLSADQVGQHEWVLQHGEKQEEEEDAPHSDSRTVDKSPSFTNCENQSSDCVEETNTR